ncbi:Enoyl-acyl-carrier-protein reductase, mitochondrial [Hondaea fermentalgiana]|uniref:Enoyl-acyl-carrier-protein reductase, mitochondrial n=1 Tax=Hondaea fermentalgiana TaxID=2315210 RepID=A0A2R5GEK9_9STRA|nr:Enoyl-acyl-carrier-protein reductase, mitochondrial [Hondaea fermentalgiana]|eukprot:GBG26671.1 Enoyl-acyl-carrier-protein reductase, mitochondrial [Hondaea fermentalgiana]
MDVVERIVSEVRAQPKVAWVAVPLVAAAMFAMAAGRKYYNETIPKSMWAMQATEKGKIELRRVPVPTPKEGEMLIKVQYSPLNPSDAHCAMDDFDESIVASYPHGIGYEASGIVVGSGGGFLPYWAATRKWRVSARDLTGVGKFWAEYGVVSVSNMVPLPSSVGMKEGSLSNINPLTALSMLVIAQEGGHKALVHTAASSTLGLQLIRAAPRFGVKIVAVVRGEKNERTLLEDMKHPADFIVRSDVSSFESDLKRAVQTTGATLAFDAINGEMSRKVYEALPGKALMHVYGELSGESMPDELASKKNDPVKPYSYYLVGPWLDAGGFWRKLKVTWYLYSMLPRELSSSVFREIDLQDSSLIDAVYAYAKNQKGGKAIIRMPAAAH